MITRMGIPLARLSLGEEELAAVAAVLRSGWVMQGPEVTAFEGELAAFLSAPHACAVSSGTAALHLALLAVGVRPGDEVVTASHSFIATANSIRHAGATPVFADVERDGFNLDARGVEAAITPRTRAILCVHQLGMPCDLEALARLATARGLALVEDAACALGSEISWRGEWQRIGRPHGDVACFSFHPRKLVTTGEGGLITTARFDLDERVRSLRNHDLAHGDGRAREVGFNYRLTDIQAAVGRVQLRRLPSLLAERRALAARYHQLLERLPVVHPREPAWARTNWQSYCVVLPDGASGDTVVRQLAERGVAARPGIINAHQMPAYAEPTVSLPESERKARQGLMLPMPAAMTEADQIVVADALTVALTG